MTYEELIQRIDEIRNPDINPEDAGMKILELKNDLAKGEDEILNLSAKIKELESDNFAKDERIKNLLKRNEELRFSLGAQYDREKEEEKEEKEEEEIVPLKEIAKII